MNSYPKNLFLIKVNIHLFFESTISLGGNTKVHVHIKKLHANVYSQFAIAKIINNTMQQQVNAKQLVIFKKKYSHNKKGQSIASPSKKLDKSQIY